VEFIIVPQELDDRVSGLTNFEELEAADEIKVTCCGG